MDEREAFDHVVECHSLNELVATVFWEKLVVERG